VHSYLCKRFKLDSTLFSDPLAAIVTEPGAEDHVEWHPPEVDVSSSESLTLSAPGWLVIITLEMAAVLATADVIELDDTFNTNEYGFAA
jgi:hypothetical protein